MRTLRSVFTLISSSTSTFAFAFTVTKTATRLSFHHGLDINSRGVRALHAEDDSGGALGKKAYNDNALFNFHMMTQAQKIRDYSAMETYVNTQSMWNLAWHESFVRNGLMDFVPPLTDTLNVLVVGNRYQGPTGEIVIAENDDPTTDTNNVNSAPIIDATNEETVAAVSVESVSLQKSKDSSCSFLAAAFDYDSSSSNKRLGEDENSSSSALDLASYDCIMDQGLIADLCEDNNDPTQNKENIARLLYEATKRIREMGIYVANTPPMTLETKEYLRALGELLGLQWEFDLDGISDENISVSVARKFGTCPQSFGKLAKVIK